MKKWYFLAILYFVSSPWVYAAADTDEKTHNSSTQQVGGLLFDVDEGVKIEKGGGGSIYLKSNRLTMEEKFKLIEKRLQGMEERLGNVEEKMRKIEQKKEKKAESSPAPGEEIKNTPEGESSRRVLIT